MTYDNREYDALSRNTEEEETDKVALFDDAYNDDSALTRPIAKQTLSSDIEFTPLLEPVREGAPEFQLPPARAIEFPLPPAFPAPLPAMEIILADENGCNIQLDRNGIERQSAAHGRHCLAAGDSGNPGKARKITGG